MAPGDVPHQSLLQHKSSHLASHQPPIMALKYSEQLGHDGKLKLEATPASTCTDQCLSADRCKLWRALLAYISHPSLPALLFDQRAHEP